VHFSFRNITCSRGNMLGVNPRLSVLFAFCDLEQFHFSNPQIYFLICETERLSISKGIFVTFEEIVLVEFLVLCLAYCKSSISISSYYYS
jgi:hypothetical protein